jgi:tetratricopeptide (TPR) repeat protein
MRIMESLELLLYPVALYALLDARPPSPVHPLNSTPNSTIGIMSINSIWLRIIGRGDMADRDDAIQAARTALEATSANDLERANQLNNLGSHLGMRYTERGAINDLEESIQLARQALAILAGHPNRGLYLNNLAVGLGDRYKHLAESADLEEAIRLGREVVSMTPPNSPHFSEYLNNLGAWLFKRHEQTGSVVDLEEAIPFSRKAVETAQNQTIRVIALSTLSTVVGGRFSRFGKTADLEEAIRVAQESVIMATECNHPLRATMLYTLADRLGDRYWRSGAIADLDEAIRAAQEAVEALPAGHPDEAAMFNCLGIFFGDKYMRTRMPNDLDQAIQYGRNVIKVTPNNHPRRTERLGNLAIRLRDRFLRTQAMADLEESITFCREAVCKTQMNHPDRARCLNNLSVPLGHKYLVTDSMNDLQEAIKVLEEAVGVTPDDHIDRATYLNNLGDRLGERYKRTGSTTDLQTIMTSHQRALHQSNSAVIHRILGGKELLRYRAITSEWEKAHEESSVAVALIPRLASRALQNSDKQHVLGQIVDLARDATAAALNAGKAPLVALHLLEQGRGILATSLEEMRTDVLVLQSSHPELATEFARLRDVLDAPAMQSMVSTDDSRDSPSPNNVNVRSIAGQEFDSLIAEIRTRRGFENFLLPPSEEEMMAAAQSGPIVLINVSEHRCDALIVEPTQIRSLALTSLNSKDIEDWTRGGDLASPKVLAWLWDTVAKPVLDNLGFNRPLPDNKWPHVWWIPTGKLSRFPLHASGYHGHDSGETVLDRVMSSYSSSIRAIIQGRRRRVKEGASTISTRALLVNMTETPEHLRLDYASQEVDVVRSLFRSRSFTCITPKRSKEDVISHLPNCTIFHFAGHGSTDRADPSNSSLLLEDWKSDPLTVANLLQTNLRRRSPFVAYLSACGTGEIKDERWFDESIHLVSACQLAGFRHVIGTLWEVNDESCVSMAKITYEEMIRGGMTDESVCLGLHTATRKLRDKWLGEVHGSGHGRKPRLSRKVEMSDSEDDGDAPLHWVPYVHFGV